MKNQNTKRYMSSRGNIEALGLSAPAGAGARCTRCPPWKGRLYPQFLTAMSDASGVESPFRIHTWVRKSTQVSSACALFYRQPIVLSIFPDTVSAKGGRGRNKRARGGKRGKRKVKEKERRRTVQKESAKEGGRGALYSSQSAFVGRSTASMCELGSSYGH